MTSANPARAAMVLGPWRAVARAVGRRLGYAVFLIIGVSALVFFGFDILPGDAASAKLGVNATPDSLASLRERMGLDEPLPQRYVDWLWGVAHGDLGTSPGSGAPVADTLLPRLKNSLILATIAGVITTMTAVLAGVIAGVRANRRTDRLISGTSLFLAGVPDFVTGLMLIGLFSFGLGWLPSASLFPFEESVFNHPEFLILPVATLVLVSTGYSTRMIRAGLVEAMESQYVELATLNGTPRKRVIFAYAVRNSIAPGVQALALTVLFLVGGVVVVETLFQYPGIGQLAVAATVARDYATISSLVLVITLGYVVVNLVTDAVIVLMTPRLRTMEAQRA